MTMDEQTLFGIMAIAQEQQKAIDTSLKALAARQAEFDTLVSRTEKAALEIELASKSAAGAIEAATNDAVKKALQAALERVARQAGSTLGKALIPAQDAFKEATAGVAEADALLRKAKSSLKWKFFGGVALAMCLLLATTVGLVFLFVPSPQEITALRATVADLEKYGAKIQLTQCGPDKRLCARIDTKAEKESTYGTSGEKWLILQGY